MLVDIESLIQNRKNSPEPNETNMIHNNVTVRYGRANYNFTGDECVKILRVYKARLDILEARMRLAAVRQQPFDSFSKLNELLRALEDRIRDTARSGLSA